MKMYIKIQNCLSLIIVEANVKEYKIRKLVLFENTSMTKLTFFKSRLLSIQITKAKVKHILNKRNIIVWIVHQQ